MRWEVAIAFTLMGGGHPCTLIYILRIYNRYAKCTKYIYLKAKEMAILLLIVEGVTVMPLQLRRMMAHPPWRGGFACPPFWKGRWRYIPSL